MKKFFSILCALAIVMSATAAPVFSKADLKKKKDAKMAQQLRAKKPAQKSTVSFRDFAKKVNLNDAKKATKELKAPQAKQEAIQIPIAKVTETFYADGSDVYVEMIDATGNLEFYFDILIAEGDSVLELGKTYTFADMDEFYSYAADYENWAAISYAAVEFTKTLNLEGYAKYDVVVLDTDSNTYVLSFEDSEFIPTGDTLEINFTEPMPAPYYYSDGSVEVGAENEEYMVNLCYYPAVAGDLTGVYTTEDFDLTYSYIYNGKKLEIKEVALEATATDKRIDVAALALAEDGNVYDITMFFLIPQKEKEASITATNLVLDDSYISWFGVVMAYASNEDFAEIYFNFSPETSDYAGTYTIGEDAGGSLLTIDSVEIDVYSGEISIAITADGAALTGKVLCFDNTEYTLNLIYVKPEKTRTEAIAADGLELALYNGAWQAAGYNADGTRYISIAAYADEVAGEYTEADLAGNYSYVYYLEDGEAVEGFSLIEANLAVTFDEATGVATIKGTFLGQGMLDATDVPEFTLDLVATIDPEAGKHLDYDNEDTAFKEVFDSYEINDKYLAQYGDLIITAQNENGAMAGLDIYIAEGDSVLTPGVYSFATTEEPMTVYTGQCDGSSVYYSFFGTLDEEGYIVDMWFPVDGKLTVLENGVIEVNAVNSYGVQIECRIGAWPEAIDNTDAKAAASKRLVKGQLIIEKNGVKYNVLGAEMK